MQVLLLGITPLLRLQSDFKKKEKSLPCVGGASALNGHLRLRTGHNRIEQAISHKQQAMAPLCSLSEVA